MNKRALLLLLCSLPAFDASAQSSAPAETRPRTVAPVSKSAAPQTPQTNSSAPAQKTTGVPAATPTPPVQTVTPPVTSTLPAPSPTTLQTPGPPASVPTTTGAVVVPTVPAVPLQPARPLALSKARARITEAQRLLKTRVAPTALGAGSTDLVTVAALDQESSQVHLLTLTKQTLLRRGAEVVLTSSQGATLRLSVVRPNYVNTSVVVADMTGRQLTPLLIEYPIEKGGRFREMAYYTSAHPALVTPEVVKAGQAYVRTMVDLAAERLKAKGFKIAPELVDIAERLCVVEHVDHDRFRREDRRTIYEEVYALYGLNELDTYRYSVSTAGAGGMVQMIPWTYQMLRQQYPSVGLNPDFVLGMRNHGNALEAMLLYVQFTWSGLMQDSEVTYALNSGLATQAELMAAGYNSNPARLGGYLRRGGTAWRTLIPRETQMYLQIYKSFDSLMPIKARA